MGGTHARSAALRPLGSPREAPGKPLGGPFGGPREVVLGGRLAGTGVPRCEVAQEPSSTIRTKREHVKASPVIAGAGGAP
jgi:hypothetical protein